MTRANDPQASTSGSSPETREADGSSIPLAPLNPISNQESSAERMGRELGRLDAVLVLIVLVLGFLVSSFAVRNSDFWMHLGAGRLMARGQYQFGVDPFTYNGNQYWVNHAWLFDLVLYGLAQAAGGPESGACGILLVGLKAVLVTGLIALMIGVRRRGQSMWIPVLCTGLAFLAMSARLALQPTILSLGFLGATLAILLTPRHGRESPSRTQSQSKGRSPLAVYWLLPVICLVWVNLDEWFFLGPVIIALYLGGQALQQLLAPIRAGEDAPEPRLVTTLGMVLLASLAACLVNPHHYRAFVLPAQFTFAWPADLVQNDRLFAPMYVKAFDPDYLQFGDNTNLAQLAYFPLLLLGVASFVLSFFHGWRWWRLFVWLGFAALAVVQTRNIPLFAVVAGPIAAFNIQDFVAGKFGLGLPESRLWKTWSLGGRVLTLGLGLLLLLAAWPGWLHALPGEQRQARRVSWSIVADPSWKKSAEQLADWRKAGWIQESEETGGRKARVFNYLPDLTNYAAWFCPPEQTVRCFYDYRFLAFTPEVTTDYLDLRRALAPGRPGPATAKQVSLPDLLRKYQIEYIWLSGSDITAKEVWQFLMRDWQRWRLVYTDGRSSVFRWNDPRHDTGDIDARPPRLDPGQLAFGPHAVQVPPRGTEQDLQPPDFWRRYLLGPPATPLETDTSEQYLNYYSVVANSWPLPTMLTSEFASWTGPAALAAVPGMSTVFAPVLLTAQTLPIREILLGVRRVDWYLRDKDSGPSAPLLLSVRYARQAIAAGPEDYVAYLRLGQAYNLIGKVHEDHWAAPGSAGGQTHRQRLRQVQATTANEHARRLRPNSPEAHYALYQLYRQMGYMDLALERLGDFGRILLALGPARDQPREEFASSVEGLQKELKSLEAEVTNRRNSFEIATQNQPLFAKAVGAARSGLGQRALSLLLELDLAKLSVQELTFLLDLLLQLGRPEDVHQYLKEEFRSELGFTYDWLRFLSEAALGNYERAGAYMDAIIDSQKEAASQMLVGLMHRQMLRGLTLESIQGQGMQVEQYRQVADFQVLRGMISLEQGKTAEAAANFRQALAISEHPEFYFESKPIAFYYLRTIAPYVK